MEYNQVMESIEVKLNERLRTLRKSSGFTIAKLAEMAKIAPHTIMDIEAGRRKGGLDAVLGLSRAFGLSVEEFIGSEKTANIQEPLQMPISKMAQMIASIPYEVYDLALKLNDLDSEAWKTTVSALEIKIEAKKAALVKSKN